MNGKRKMNRRYGNAQTIGSNVHQNTYFMIKQEQDSTLAVLADGTIDAVTGAYAAILTCETIARGFVFGKDIEWQLERQFARAASVLNERIYRGRQPRVSALAACFRRGSVTYRRAGDMFIAGLEGRDLTVWEPERGKRRVKSGFTLLCSQGLWQSLTEIEIESMLSGRSHPYRKAQNMIEAINRRNLKDQKSTVLVIA